MLLFCPVHFSGNGQELGACSLTLFLDLGDLLLDFHIFALCDLLISLSIDVIVGSDSVVAFGIVGVILPFFLIIIVILVFAVGINVTFSSTYFTSYVNMYGVHIVVLSLTESYSYSYSRRNIIALIWVLLVVYHNFLSCFQNHRKGVHFPPCIFILQYLENIDMSNFTGLFYKIYPKSLSLVLLFIVFVMGSTLLTSFIVVFFRLMSSYSHSQSSFKRGVSFPI